MKLPPLPDNNTDRILIQYTSFGQQHVAELRVADGISPATAIDVYNGYANLMKALITTSDVITGARFAEKGTLVSFPLTVSAVQGTNAGAPPADNKPNFISIVGRSPTGYRTRFTVFTGVYGEASKYRMYPGEGAAAFALLNYMKADTNTFFAKDGVKAIINNYINLGVNSYFQRRQRRTN